MDLRGHRFELDFSDDEEKPQSSPRVASNHMPSIPFPFVADIKERETAPPSAPKMKCTPSGFPEHKKRIRVSAFKQQRAGSARPPAVGAPNAFAPRPAQPTHGSSRNQKDSGLDEDRRRIDQENAQRLAAMSPEEIAEERRELMSSLDPSLIQMLMMRSNLDDGRGDTGTDLPSEILEKETSSVQEKTRVPQADTKTVPGAHSVPAPKPSGKRIDPPRSVRFEDEESEPSQPIGLQPTSAPGEPVPEAFVPSIHFPAAPSAPELDPSDPDFLQNLHTKYFPSLPADPSKLAWMAPLPTTDSIADRESPYYPLSESLNANAIRFDFRGGLLPPRIARAVPVTKGLHHHGEAPEAAGYTVPELARLARSAFPAQRCVAFQTLGRLLYRLGRGEWGGPESEITHGLWMCVKGGKVLETLEEAAAAEGGHQGSKVYAVEALWLWQKGGGEVMKAE